MFGLEGVLIDLLLTVFSREEINLFLRDPRNTATLVGAAIAVSGALLGTFLLLRGMALTSDAISHTVLLGIVGAFLLLSWVLGRAPDLSSPWLIVGAAAAGVATVVLTELIYRSGLVRQDAALGLAFPLLFALAIILISRFVDDAHMDEHAVMVGEIGVAWADTNSHCYANCETVTITPDDPRAETIRQCTNCQKLDITPRDSRAEFAESCANCGTYSPAQAWSTGLIETQPELVFWPRSLTVNGLFALISILFVTVFYKELKLAAFDEALAKTLGFRPGVLHYTLMILVSLVAVGAFDAVGSILVIAFFIIPPAAAYLLTDRLALMLVIASFIGAAGAWTGYDLARGTFLWVFDIGTGLAWLNTVFGLGLVETWDSSISASIVLMIFFFFLVSWVLSPRYGLVSTLLRRADQRRRFDDQVVLAHVYNHQHTPEAATELREDTFYEHFRWSRTKMTRVMTRLRAANLVRVPEDRVLLTERGEARVQQFRDHNLTRSG